MSVGFAIVGAGAVADGFAADLRRVSDARLVAVNSRRRVAADGFASRHGCRVHDTVRDLAEDPEVDVVYVATPNHRHAEVSMEVISAGKGVLCEKPFALDAGQAADVIAAAKERSVFCMEAMWTRFIPAIGRAIDAVERGVIGEIRSIHVDFSINAPYEPNGRLFDPSQGGGALLDLGVYGLALSNWLLGTPSDVRSTATFAPTGVDAAFTALLRHDGGAIATISAALTSAGPNEAVIAGTHGTIRLPRPICAPRALRIVDTFPRSNGQGGTSEAVRTCDRVARLARRATRALDIRRGVERHRFAGSGYHFEISEVIECLRAGRTESPLLPLADTLTAMSTLDRVRSSWGNK